MARSRISFVLASLAGFSLIASSGAWLAYAQADPGAESAPTFNRATTSTITVDAAPVQAAAAPAPQPAAYVVKRVLDIPGAMRPGNWHWNETGVLAGPVVITVDLKAQTISVFRDGYEIGAAVVL